LYKKETSHYKQLRLNMTGSFLPRLKLFIMLEEAREPGGCFLKQKAPPLGEALN
jgi:hypothetical protein